MNYIQIVNVCEVFKCIRVFNVRHKLKDLSLAIDLVTPVRLHFHERSIVE